MRVATTILYRSRIAVDNELQIITAEQTQTALL